jgi:Bardet-Biedl syndrome 1 protein
VWEKSTRKGKNSHEKALFSWVFLQNKKFEDKTGYRSRMRISLSILNPFPLNIEKYFHVPVSTSPKPTQPFQLIFATRDNRIMFFSVRGKCLNEMKIEGKIVDIAQFYYEPRQYQGILVAVKNEVLLYVEMFLVDRIRMDADIEWMRFGRMGREEGVLLVGTVSGGLCAKIFRRTAILGASLNDNAVSLQSTMKLNVPRRTKAFIDQTLRERDNPQRLHRVGKIFFIVGKFSCEHFAEG